MYGWSVWSLRLQGLELFGLPLLMTPLILWEVSESLAGVLGEFKGGFECSVQASMGSRLRPGWNGLMGGMVVGFGMALGSESTTGPWVGLVLFCKYPFYWNGMEWKLFILDCLSSGLVGAGFVPLWGRCVLVEKVR